MFDAAEPRRLQSYLSGDWRSGEGDGKPLLNAGTGDGLKAEGLSEDQIKFELFTSAQPGRLKVQRASSVADNAGECELSLTLDGTTRNLKMSHDGTPVLQAALDEDLDAPFSCRAGVLMQRS